MIDRTNLLMLAMVAALTCLSTSVYADGTCDKAPAFVGTPTGVAAFSVTGEAVKAGTKVVMNVGDELVVSVGEGGISAVSLYAEDGCGLWLQHTKSASYLSQQLILESPTYTTVSAKKDGLYEVVALGHTFSIERLYPGRFEVILVTAIPAYVGE